MHVAMLAFVERAAEPWGRREREGHLTASAWVVNPTRDRVLLVHHAKLERWFQPGGHIEPGDDTLADAALREAREETGLTALRLESDALFDVDVHTIPARGDAPEHLHYDCRFLIVADTAEAPVCSSESHDVRWFGLGKALAIAPEASTRRMVAKTQRGRV